MGRPPALSDPAGGLVCGPGAQLVRVNRGGLVRRACGAIRRGARAGAACRRPGVWHSAAPRSRTERGGRSGSDGTAGGRQRLSDPVGEAGGGGDVLKHSDGAWLRAAAGAEGMHTHLGPVKSELETAHEGLLAGTAGLTALAELGAVRESWERRFESARGSAGLWPESSGPSPGPRAGRTRR